MTDRHDTPEPHDSDAIGRRIQELALDVEAPATLRMRLAEDRRAAAPVRSPR
ncbi:MAG: hypothetical protein JWQ18_325, partial [Conexibacter sp.]|nr:hypothetical protein [Conexibacter sp.]